MANWIVVGGGIAGLMSARLLLSRGEQVVLIEREDECGGLLRSWCSPDHIEFDYGTHIPAATGVPDLDSLLFTEEDIGIKWSEIGLLKVGVFFNGSLSDQSSFMDIRSLPSDVYSKIISELMDLPGDMEPDDDCLSYLNGFYGETLTQHSVLPLVQKFYHCSPELLMHDAAKKIGLGRFVAFSSSASRRIKSIPFFDERIAFNHYSEGARETPFYYPFQNGIGEWVKSLLRKIENEGGVVLTSMGLKSIAILDKKITSVELNSGEIFAADHVLWSAPVAMLSRLMGGERADPPKFVPMILHHFVFDRPPLSEVFYLYCNEPSMDSFRVTLYSNFQKEMSGFFKVTVEACHWGGELGERHSEKILNELRRMNLVSPEAVLLYKYDIPIKNGFPIVTKDVNIQESVYKEFCLDKATNLSLVGRSTDSFFMADVLNDAYSKVVKLIDD